ncbi:DUF1731 domain-containing protein [Pedobacter aquae]|uniref:DUF1731 domain-containing protein n=1 Tax=Pedobacter aquae TaxID=2605747 RepID=UPI0021CEE084|nr:DUF1731 domain-containing protein [Pedobacter aquae]
MATSCTCFCFKTIVWRDEFSSFRKHPYGCKKIQDAGFKFKFPDIKSALKNIYE